MRLIWKRGDEYANEYTGVSLHCWKYQAWNYCCTIMCFGFAARFLTEKLCKRCLHKLRGIIMLRWWIRLKLRKSISGMRMQPYRMAGLEMFLSIKLKSGCISDRYWRIRSQILNIVCHLRRVNLRCRPWKTRMYLISFLFGKTCSNGILSRHWWL